MKYVRQDGGEFSDTYAPTYIPADEYYKSANIEKPITPSTLKKAYDLSAIATTLYRVWETASREGKDTVWITRQMKSYIPGWEYKTTLNMANMMRRQKIYLPELKPEKGVTLNVQIQRK